MEPGLPAFSIAFDVHQIYTIIFCVIQPLTATPIHIPVT